MSRVLRKCQFSDPSERALLTNKLSVEVLKLEQWFSNMGSSLGNKVIQTNLKYNYFFHNLNPSLVIILKGYVRF
jgi:hypothetical protein